MEEREFPCDKCEKRFTYRKDLTRHLLTHANYGTDATRYSCLQPECVKRNISFLRKDKFASHMRAVHQRLGCKTHTCDSGGEGFRSMYDLRRHEASRHDRAEKVYRCRFANCKKKNKVWKRWDNLKCHIEKQHGEKCAKHLMERSALLRLIRTHCTSC